MSDEEKQARIKVQTQTEEWESLLCSDNDEDFRELAHSLLDEWLDFMEGESPGSDGEDLEEDFPLTYRRLVFQECQTDQHYKDED